MAAILSLARHNGGSASCLALIMDIWVRQADPSDRVQCIVSSSIHAVKLWAVQIHASRLASSVLLIRVLGNQDHLSSRFLASQSISVVCLVSYFAHRRISSYFGEQERV